MDDCLSAWHCTAVGILAHGNEWEQASTGCFTGWRYRGKLWLVDGRADIDMESTPQSVTCLAPSTFASKKKKVQVGARGTSPPDDARRRARLRNFVHE